MLAKERYTGKLFIISGPSGAGKGTICKALMEGADPEKMCLSVSMTTRQPREGEVHGVNYYFVSEEEFLETIDRKGFLEHAQVYGNRYGTPRDLVLEKLKAGVDVVLEIDIQGALSIKKNYPEGIFIFILPPSMAELRKRITGRGTETAEAIEHRLSQTLKEVSYIEEYDYVVVNGELHEAVARVRSIVTAEHSKVTESVYKIIDKYKEEI